MRLDIPALGGSRATSSTVNEERGAVCTAPGSRNVVSKVVAPERMPENFPAQPRQYLAPSLLGVWHDSQNFVILMIPRLASWARSPVAWWIGGRRSHLRDRDERRDDHQ